MSIKPNVLFILSDQHNAKCLGAAGHPLVKTPNLDRLAAEGVRFTAAVTQSPICSPSRICYMSGQYPHNHGYYGNEGPRPAALPSILGHFRANGYRTAMVGKNHTPCGWIEPECDYYRGAYADTDHPPGTTHSDFDLYLQEKGLLADRDDNVFPEQTDFTRMAKDARRSRLPYADSVEGWCAAEARRFIEQTGDAPWIMQVGLPRPHQNYSPSTPFWELYGDDLPMPPNADIDLSLKSPHLREMRRRYESGMEEYLFGEKTYLALRRRKLRGYYGLISQTDHAVGEILDFLRQRGLENDTIVVYSSDHGEYACEFGLLEKAPGICADAVTRVPYIWRWPGRIPAARQAQHVIEACIDYATTICSLTGLPEFATGDGCDLTPLLMGNAIQADRIGVTEHPWSKSVRKGPWRFVYYPREMFAAESPDRPVGELYNLDDDPWEIHNLFYDPGHQAIVVELQAALLDWLATSDRVVTAHPPIPSGNPAQPHRLDGDNRASPHSIREHLSLRGQKNYL